MSFAALSTGRSSNLPRDTQLMRSTAGIQADKTVYDIKIGEMYKAYYLSIYIINISYITYKNIYSICVTSNN